MSGLMRWTTVFLPDSLEDNGDVPSGSGTRETCHTEGALLQVAL